MFKMKTIKGIVSIMARLVGSKCQDQTEIFFLKILEDWVFNAV